MFAQIDLEHSQDYCLDVGVDSELLADLDDIAVTAQNVLLSQDNLNSEIVTKVIHSLEKYINLFDKGVEFNIISSGFIELNEALESISIAEIDEEEDDDDDLEFF